MVMDTATLEALTKLGAVRNWQAGDTVTRRGDTMACVTLCLSGRYRVVAIAKDGQEHIFRLLEHGELFGVPTAVAGVPFPTDVICVDPGQTVEVNRVQFLHFLSKNPSASLAVIANLSHRIGEMFELIETDSLAALPDRVRQRLRQLGDANGRPDHKGGLRLDFTQNQIAQAVNGSNYRVHLELKALAAKGEIELGYGYITLLKMR